MNHGDKYVAEKVDFSAIDNIMAEMKSKLKKAELTEERYAKKFQVNKNIFFSKLI